MKVCSETEQEDDVCLMQYKKLALRDAVICIGWLKLLSVIYYVCLYYLVHIYSKGDVSLLLQIMLLAAVPFQIFHAVLLFYGAIEGRLVPLEVGIWLCLIIASYNTILGTIGCIFFVRTGNVAMHFVLAFAFIMLAFSLFTVLCHDVLMVYAYKQILIRMQEQNNLECCQSSMSRDNEV